MMQGCENALAAPLPRRAPRVAYRSGEVVPVLAEYGTLAVFGFGGGAPASDDPRCFRVALESFDAPAPLELWQVDAEVTHGRDGDVRWAAGGGWLFAAVELDEAAHGGSGPAATHAYQALRRVVEGRTERHVLRIWNYLEAINQGEGDAARYK